MPVRDCGVNAYGDITQETGPTFERHRRNNDHGRHPSLCRASYTRSTAQNARARRSCEVTLN